MKIDALIELAHEAELAKALLGLKFEHTGAAGMWGLRLIGADKIQSGRKEDMLWIVDQLNAALHAKTSEIFDHKEAELEKRIS